MISSAGHPTVGKRKKLILDGWHCLNVIDVNARLYAHTLSADTFTLTAQWSCEQNGECSLPFHWTQRILLPVCPTCYPLPTPYHSMPNDWKDVNKCKMTKIKTNWTFSLLRKHAYTRAHTCWKNTFHCINILFKYHYSKNIKTIFLDK